MVEVLQLSDARTDGAALGQSPTDKIAFYTDGKTAGFAVPVVQPSGNAQAQITRGGAAGVVATYAVTNSPASVATLTTVELGMTLVGGTGASITIATTDLLFINKPTSQAGLGVGNVRVSSAGVAGVSFLNLSAGFLTPTASQIYGVVALRGLNSVTTVLSPAAVAANTTAEQLFTVTGIRAGELVAVNKATVDKGLDIVNVRVAGPNQVGITFANVTAGTLTPAAAQTYTVISLGGLDALNNDVLFQVSAAPVAVATLTTAVGTLTIANLAVSDTITGIQKPTNQAGLIAGSGLVSAAGVGGVVFGNFTTASITPTANEVYGVRVWRPNPVAPLVLYSATLTPASVAANTTAEQTFAVTGLISGTPVWVNKPSVTSGIGITGCRVSSTNNVGITFANFTSVAIVPPSETYLIGNFQMPVPDTGCTIIQSASIVEQQTSQLGNAMRGALVSLGLMAGA